jgi:hypothetical protein
MRSMVEGWPGEALSIVRKRCCYRANHPSTTHRFAIGRPIGSLPVYL